MPEANHRHRKRWQGVRADRILRYARCAQRKPLLTKLRIEGHEAMGECFRQCANEGETGDIEGQQEQLMNDYRNQAPRVEDVLMLPDGPAVRCPACGAESLDTFLESTKRVSGESVRTVTGRHKDSQITAPLACTDRKRVRIGFLRRCKIDGDHLHEHCKNCGHDWLTRFAGEP